MIRALACLLGVHVLPAGLERRHCIAFECARCKRLVEGAARSRASGPSLKVRQTVVNRGRRDSRA